MNILAVTVSTLTIVKLGAMFNRCYAIFILKLSSDDKKSTTD